MSEYFDIAAKELFFITGRGRSGTWLLQSILNAHPDICVAPEALFMLHLYPKYTHTKVWTPKRKAAFVNDLFTEKKIEKWWKITPESLQTLLEKYPLESSFAELCKAIYYQYAELNDKQNVRLLGDKNPEYSLHIERLARLYPRAKFIHLVRDPRANILSYKNVGFDINNTAALAFRWKKYNEAVLKLAQAMPERILLVHYEAMLQNSSETLTTICSFLGVDYRDDLLEFYKSSKNIFPWNHKIAQAIEPAKANDWQKKMTPKDEACIFKIAGDIAMRLGYQSQVKPHISPFDYCGWWFGRLTFFLEKLLFKLPLPLRAAILKAYRKRSSVL